MHNVKLEHHYYVIVKEPLHTVCIVDLGDDWPCQLYHPCC